MRTLFMMSLLFVAVALAWGSALAQPSETGKGSRDGPRTSQYVSGKTAPIAKSVAAGDYGEWSTRQRIGVLAAGWLVVALAAAAAVAVSRWRRQQAKARRVPPLAVFVSAADHPAAAPARAASQPSAPRTESRRAA